MVAKPENGYTTNVDLVRVIDGDTIEVKIERTFKIRLLDPTNIENKLFGAAELSTPDGIKARDFLQSYLAKNKDKQIRIFIPSHNSLHLLDVYTFDRILAHIWVGNENLSEVMMKNGFCSLNQKNGEK